MGTPINIGTFSTNPINVTGSLEVSGSLGVTGNTIFSGSLDVLSGITGSIRTDEITSPNLLNINITAAGMNVNGVNENTPINVTGSLLMGSGSIRFGRGFVQFEQVTGSSIYQVGTAFGGEFSVSDQPSNAKLFLATTESFTVPVSSSIFSGIARFNKGIENGLVVTGSMNVNGNTTITGVLNISSSLANDLVVTGSVAITRPVGSTADTRLVVTSSVGRTSLLPSSFEALNSSTQNIVYGNGLGFGMYNDNTLDELGFTIDPTNFGISGGTGNSIYVNDPTDSYPAMINFQNKANWTDGRISLQKNTDITGSVRITDIPTGSSTNFVVWNSSSKQLEYTSGGGSGSSGTSGTSGTSGDSIFVQTGSFWNTTRNVGITGSLRLSGSATYDLEVTGSARFVNNNNSQINTITPNTFNINTTNAAGINAENYIFGHTGSVSSVYIGVYDDPNFNQDVEMKISVDTGSGIGFADWDNGSAFDYVKWLTVAPNTGNNPAPQFKRSIAVSGSLRVSGSAIVTGSVQGNVNALSISSNTASLNLNNGNFFTLQLVSGSNTFINPSNIKAGQTVNILLSTTGSATVSFPSSVLQVSGSSYVPTTTTGKDVITLVSFDSTNLYLANVKNLV